jgi:hypothetical protein
MSRPSKNASRDKRTRIMLIAGLAVLGIVLVIQGPTLLDAFGGGSSDPAPADATASSASAGDGAQASSSADGAVPAVSSPGRLPNSDIPPQADQDQHTTLSRFNPAGDPFVALVEEPTETTEPATDPSTDLPTGDAPSGDAATGSEAPESTEPAPAPSEGGDGATGAPGDAPASVASVGVFGAGSGVVARLRVNDLSQSVEVGDAFPTSDPVFRLVSVESGAMNVGLVTGAFSTGSTTIRVEEGETRTLVSQPDGTRYRVQYLGY